MDLSVPGHDQMFITERYIRMSKTDCREQEMVGSSIECARARVVSQFLLKGISIFMLATGHPASLECPKLAKCEILR